MGDREYDVIIIGGGPAGLAAGLYAARARLRSLLLERVAAGGWIVNAELVENYLGFPQGISGPELAGLMDEQAKKYGLEVLLAEVIGLKLEGKRKVIKTAEGDFTARTVIIASGSDRVKLDVPGEEEFTGRGVAYCAICDAAFFRDVPVAVVGGGNAAIGDAMYLSKFAARVTVLHRRQQLRATSILQERAFAEPKIEFRWNTVVAVIEGGAKVERLRLRNVRNGEESTLDVPGIFIALGSTPNTGYLKDSLPLDTRGAIITNEKMETGVPGIFAAGDIRANSIRQVVAATGDGATAAVYAEKFIAE
ncbi:MAG: thioredoxin-disulfide reductase [Dehalococcoidales bacterium]|jgi:thioredoxin reductase (NADPH)|nr:thioredoxin-disulfide reductase [Dehalococcoidales bacterium]MDP6448987.1 thioredoxin-disulfide reductase [Dehalococcoidales bacterium]MDP6577088.1 thioredoxin-disulfide reductase [Dehalococcoidales bacterium]MDP6824958.1 thioredoxin-disulfide reductase [Dehalococcoidales bacterium]|tara:strand:+ start:433 stop:1353 length:921 start_codon:yes stop_codon:yes gene_type:complete